ncbi:helix-turn-helix domain-containing protein [Oscillospiraceae bacterium 50-16]
MLEEYADILTVDEACEVLRVGYNALYALLGSGELKAYRNGRTWRIPKLAVMEYILESSKIKMRERIM